MLLEVPKSDDPKHTGICSIDGEPWPCLHLRREAHFACSNHFKVRCKHCDKPRNMAASLDIAEGFDGQPVYFHGRQKCRAAAEMWWNENVRVIVDEPFHCQWIDSLLRHIALRQGLKLRVATQA